MRQGNTERKALTADEACIRYDLNPRTLANYRSRRIGPRFYKRGSKVFYKPEDVESWLFANPVQTVDSVECG